MNPDSTDQPYYGNYALEFNTLRNAAQLRADQEFRAWMVRIVLVAVAIVVGTFAI
jgi:hypothetical protein